MNIRIRKYRNKISAPLAHRLIDYRGGDVFLSSFPRSGSTWVRTMLSLIRSKEVKVWADLYNDNIPAVSLRNVHKIRTLKSPRIIMTHGKYVHGIQKAVYIIRDGRDALVSYYHYSTTRVGETMPFSEFFRLYEAGIYGPTWGQHVTSWLSDGRNQLQDRMLAVKFEQLKDSAESELAKVCSFLSLDFTDEDLERAIELSSLSKMREIENAEGNVVRNPSASFYRSGEVNKWQNYFDRTTYDRFIESTGDAMRLAGYI